MGLLIIFITLAVIGILLMRKHYFFDDWQRMIGAVSLFVGSFVSIVLILIMIITAISAPIQLSTLQQESKDYQIIIDNTYAIEAQPIYAKAIEFNKNVRQKRICAHSFLLMGLESQLWDEVPLVKFPYE